MPPSTDRLGSSLERLRVLGDSLLALHGAERPRPLPGSVASGGRPEAEDLFEATARLLEPLKGRLVGPRIPLNDSGPTDPTRGRAPTARASLFQQLRDWVMRPSRSDLPSRPADPAVVLLGFSSSTPPRGGAGSRPALAAVVLTARGELRAVRPWAISYQEAAQAHVISTPDLSQSWADLLTRALLVEQRLDDTALSPSWTEDLSGPLRAESLGPFDPSPLAEEGIDIVRTHPVDVSFFAPFRSTPAVFLEAACAAVEQTLLQQIASLRADPGAHIPSAAFKGLLVSTNPAVRIQAVQLLGNSNRRC